MIELTSMNAGWGLYVRLILTIIVRARMSLIAHAHLYILDLSRQVLSPDSKYQRVPLRTHVGSFFALTIPPHLSTPT